MPLFELESLYPDDCIRVWLGRNRGIVSHVARKHNVTRAWVSAVLYGVKGARSEGHRIERALARAGAPFMAERLRIKKSA